MVHAGPVDEEILGGQSTASAEFLRMTGIEKHFGGVYALRGADLRLRSHEVHGLIGQNGSGKSTLLSVLSGQLRPSAGTIEILGAEVALTRPDVALGHGIAMVTQELTLAPDLSVGENIFLGHGKPQNRLGIDWKNLHRQAAELLERLELDVDPRARVGGLRLDQQQLVEVARAISSAARVVILDEPTSSLADSAVARLMAMVRRLRSDGVGVVFVSHRMDELYEISDHITVLRDGLTVGSRPAAEYTRGNLVADMLGREPEEFSPSPSELGEGDAAMVVAELAVDRALAPLSFRVREREIVGLVGLTGSGRTEVLQALFGARPDAQGLMDLGSGPGPLPVSPVDAVRRGVGYVPGDRKAEGLILGMSIRDNIALAPTSLRSRWQGLRRGEETRDARAAIAAMQIVAPSPDAPVGSLSGGNQQKVLLSKWLATGPRLLMLDEPTRGVDVAAKAEIHSLLRKARDEGMGVLVSSSEIEELLVLCDRFLVLVRGTMVAELSRDDATEERLIHLMSGGPSRG